MIDWLIKQISEYESLDNNKEVKRAKQQEQELGRDNAHDYIRMMEEFIILTMIICKEDYSVYMNSIAAVDEDFFEGV